jgi:formate dehydrogenase subunit gamma
MRRWLQVTLCALACALPLFAAQAQAPTTPPDLPDPKAETNAERAKSQPLNNAPMWRAVKDGGGITSLPGVEKGVLIQPQVNYPGAPLTSAGEAWRQVRNQVILPYGGALIGIMLLACILWYWRHGTLGQQVPDGGRKIERFTPFERAAHWTNAIAFVILAVSGFVMAFGKYLLLPLIGSTLFGYLTYVLKTAHNFVGPAFAVSLVIVIITFIRDNFPRREDWTWVFKAGGLIGGREVASHRFNGGEKLLFWVGVFSLGLVVIASGLFLDKLVPGFAYTRGEMQIAHMIHAAASLMMMTAFLGHIYMGTIGMKGAFSAMRTGYVDEAWAHHHHELWAEDIRAGKIPAQRSQPQASSPVAKPT